MFKIVVRRYLINVTQYHVYKTKQIFGIYTERVAPRSSIKEAL